MTYQETLDWMFSRLPMYQRQGKSAFKKDLTNILAFTKYLGDPHKKIRTVHVGGTNGKGSTSHMIASILQEAGYKVGLYTSPHLKNFTERIKINGEEVSQDTVVKFISNTKFFLESQGLSFFEMTVGMAFSCFEEEQVDIAIIEVGLGGRLDSTNILNPEVSVITNIGLDHTQFLGTTLEEIAFEKAGIIKKNTHVVIGEYQREVEFIFKDKAREMNSNIVFASQSDCSYKTDLLGSYQINNISTAYAAISSLQGFEITDEAIEKGFLNVQLNTGLKGRWQILQNEPKVICDTAHNKEGLTFVMNQLAAETYDELHIVLGMVSDKNVLDILGLFPKKAMYYFCKPKIPRALSENILFDKAKELGFKGDVFNSVNEAFKASLSAANENDMVYIGGSTFVVAEII